MPGLGHTLLGRVLGATCRQLLEANGKGLEVPGVARLLDRSVPLLSLLLLRLFFAAQHAMVPASACWDIKLSP